MKKAISLRIEEDLVKVLTDYAATKGISQAAVVEKFITSIKSEDSNGFIVNELPQASDDKYITREEMIKFAQVIDTMQSEIEDLKDANNYLHNPLYPFIENPRLVQTLIDNQEEVIDFIERLKDPAMNKAIGIIPEALGGRSY